MVVGTSWADEWQDGKSQAVSLLSKAVLGLARVVSSYPHLFGRDAYDPVWGRRIWMLGPCWNRNGWAM